MDIIIIYCYFHFLKFTSQMLAIIEHFPAYY